MIIIKINNKLTERDTDIAYGVLGNFIIDLIQKTASSLATIEPVTEDGRSFPVIRMKPKAPGIQTQSDGSTIDSFATEYEKYKKDTRDESTVVRNVDDLRDIVNGLTLEIRPKSTSDDEKTGGYMTREGLMVIYEDFGGYQPILASLMRARFDRFYVGKDGVVKGDKVMADKGKEAYAKKLYGPKVAAAAQSILNNINTKEYRNRLSRIMSHEFGHYVNGVRSSQNRETGVRSKAGVKDFRSSGGPRGENRQFEIGTKEYARSTEELQARFGEVFSNVYRFLNMKFPDIEDDLDRKYGLDTEDFIKKYQPIVKSEVLDRYDYFALQMIRASMLSNPNKGMDAFLNRFKHSVFFSYFEKEIDVKAENIIKKRAYELFQTIKSNYSESRKNPTNHPIFTILRYIPTSEFNPN